MVGIYTKTGDSGQTSLLSGERTDKDCLTLKVIGEIDELNTVLGIVLSKLKNEDFEFESLFSFLKMVQQQLFILNAELACLQNERIVSSLEKISEGDIKKMEEKIDEMWADLPPLENFILPNGTIGGYFHLGRAICRRAERELVSLGKEKKVGPEPFMYLNRLSDFLFASARWVNFKMGEEEIKFDS